MMSNKVYDIIKHITMIGLPAVAAFYVAIAGIWGLPYGEEVAGTITALVALIGSFLGVSSAQYHKEGKVK